MLPTEAMEGFGIVTIEALASGTPVLGTPAGATSEILGPRPAPPHPGHVGGRDRRRHPLVARVARRGLRRALPERGGGEVQLGPRDGRGRAVLRRDGAGLQTLVTGGGAPCHSRRTSTRASPFRRRPPLSTSSASGTVSVSRGGRDTSRASSTRADATGPAGASGRRAPARDPHARDRDGAPLRGFARTRQAAFADPSTDVFAVLAEFPITTKSTSSATRRPISEAPGGPEGS